MLSITGIALSVGVLIVVLSVINGFETELRDRFLSANAHVLAYRYPNGLRNVERWEEKLRQDFGSEITGVSPFIHYETMIKKGPLMHSVLVRGFEPYRRETVQSIVKSVEPQTALKSLQKQHDDMRQSKTLPAVPEIILGAGVLSIIDAKVGDLISLISPRSSDNNRVMRFRIVGIYHSGLKHYDNRLVAMALPVAQKFFQMGPYVTGLEIGLVEPDQSRIVAGKMLDQYSLSIKEWQSFNRPLLEALKTERVVIMLIVALAAVVASFNILTTLFVAVTLKQREISILRALGARSGQIISLFLKQGILFGCIGGSLGSVLALGASFLIEKYQFIDLPDPYFLTNLPVDYDWRIYVSFAGTGVLFCMIASVFPALSAARVLPSEGVKGTGEAL